MKKILFLALFMIGTLAVHADDYAYPYLVFETADGTKTSVAITDGTITIANGQLTMGGQTFALADLSKMYFSTTTTGITNVNDNVNVNDEVSIYTLSGISLGKFQNVDAAKTALNKGIYVVKTVNTTYKIAIK